MFLPKIEKPHPDELLYSWISRTIQELGMNQYEFGAYCLHNGKGYKRPLKVDLGYDYVRFFKLAHMDVGMKELYQSTSTVPFESISMSDNRQMRYINSIFCPEGPFRSNLQSMYEPMRLCPECMKEDREQYGHVYLHRSHNLSGVCVCHKHGCKLLQYKGHSGHEYEYSLDNYEEMSVSLPMEDALDYAVYSRALLMSGINSDSYHVKNVIMDKIKDGEHTVNDAYDIFIENVQKWEHAILFDGVDLDHRMRTILTNASNMSMREVVPFFMYLYPDMKELIKTLQKDEPVLEQYTCPDCHRVYCATPQSQRNGWGCPYCNEKKPTQERFKELVEASGEGEYEPLDPFVSMNKKVRFCHKKCGEEFAMTPGRFLLDGARCECEHHIMEAEAKRAVQALPGAFVLKRFSKTNEESEFYCKECGHEFKCTYNNFIKRPACRICGDNIRRTSERFEFLVQELVGDEYTVEGDFVDKSTGIAIKHNVCGHTHVYRPDAFLNGQRCPDCTDRVSREELEDMLEAYSNGRYVLKGQTKSSCILLNTETNEKMTIMTTRMLQEMRRPTPSSVLPVDESKRKELPPSAWDKKYELLLRYKEEYGTANATGRKVYHGVRLGVWCRYQRLYHNNGTLSYGRTKKLEKIGFSWDVSVDALWEETFELLKEYQEENSTYIPSELEYKGVRIGRWAMDQRRMNRENKLKPERKEKLEGIGFEFEHENRRGHQNGWTSKKLDDDWNRKYKLLVRYKKQYGTVDIPTRTVYRKVNLGQWINQQRVLYFKGKLPQWRIDKLEQIGFPWRSNALNEEWDERFALLVKYKGEHGNVDVPYAYQDEGITLGHWVSRQRTLYRQGSMSDERIQKLEGIGFKWRT